MCSAVTRRAVGPADALVALFARSSGADEAVTEGNIDNFPGHYANGRRKTLVGRAVHGGVAAVVDRMGILTLGIKMVVYPDANPKLSTFVAAPPIRTAQGAV